MTTPVFSADHTAASANSKAWPFEEARRLIKRLERLPGGNDKTVLFETGYGPSGLPHIGTFGEVARTTMVRRAFELLTGGERKTHLICFSDDMDGLRKVPTNVPNQEMLQQYLDKPLTQVPDPFGKFESFAHHNNAMLRDFLDRFGFEYEFYSASQCYKSGLFDETLLKMLAAYDKVMDIILPTLGPERQATYSPFLPVSERTGKVLQVPMIARDVAAGTITYADPETGEKIETLVTGGRVKCQWKADWAMRWTALGVDYEMAGKDLIDSVTLSSKVCKALGGTPPEGFNYELFLDQNGEKISKSRGNGLTIEEWLTYASPESLSLFMFQKPKSAKKLYFDVIPRAVDEYLQFLSAYPGQEAKQQLDNPVWHIHTGQPPAPELPITFGLLLNLVSVSNAENKDVLWGFLRRYSPGATPENNPILDRLSDRAVRYFDQFVRPTKKFRAPDEVEVGALKALDETLASLPTDADSNFIQNALLDVGRAIPRYQDTTKVGPNGGPGVKLDWFQAIYEVLLGQERGPRLGTFIALYGIPETRALIAKALNGELGS
ncbi:lysine--tRNA ligase [Hyphomicrobium methylovorum]|uniref:lysine--tRNA ligase n=1 Tax=Hyphomicrobium methylovorum TaxID=84 RepID=UPI0015E6BFD3|nr:lysine--tRNA ligase [Hyphomicrobium methylovorum]MBA2125519.1 lysine--tRNA ligase [Hyphomicrobium methylovorum]